jgi:hypothetical protein
MVIDHHLGGVVAPVPAGNTAFVGRSCPFLARNAMATCVNGEMHARPREWSAVRISIVFDDNETILAASIGEAKVDLQYLAPARAAVTSISQTTCLTLSCSKP